MHEDLMDSLLNSWKNLQTIFLQSFYQYSKNPSPQAHFLPQYGGGNEDGGVCVLPHPYTRQESSWRFILRFNLPFKCKWDSFKNATQSLRGGFALNISRWLASSKGANHFIMSDVHLISFTVLLHQLWQKYYCLWMQRKLLIGWNGNICYVF